MPRQRRRPAERALAWLYTGPLGHLYSVVVDLLVFAFERLWERAQGRTVDGEGSADSARR